MHSLRPTASIRWWLVTLDFIRQWYMCSLQWSARGAIQVLDSCANTTMIYVDVSTVGRTLEGLNCSTNTPGFTSPRSAYWFYFRRPITKFSALECNMTTECLVQFAVIKLICCSIPYCLETYCFLSLTRSRCSIFLRRRPIISHKTDLIRLHSLWGLRLV